MRIAVIGGGPAGRTAAMRLAAAGEEVRLYDPGWLGGQCLHHGCMVICALNDVARHVDQAAVFRRLGILASATAVDFSAVLREMAAVQAVIRGVIERETEEAGVGVIREEAALDGAQLLVGGRPVEADRVLVATGSRPQIPPVEGIDLAGVYTPHTLTTMDRLPGRLAIIGGGVIAAEYAHIFRAFGSSVELICRSSLLKDLDERQGAAARKDLEGVTITEATEVLAIRGGGRVRTILTRSGDEPCEREVDAVIVATGLVPQSEKIAGIAKGPRGEVLVDAAMRTSVSGVFAAGDVTGPPYYTPVARKEGVVAADSILGRPAAMDYTAIPSAVHLRYDHASCRLPGEESAGMSIPAPAGPGSFWSVPDRATGMARLEVVPETGAITGVAASAPGAAMITAYLGYLIRQGATVQDLKEIMEVHPSSDGIYWLVKYAADRLGGGGPG